MNDLEIIGPRLTYSCALDTSVILRWTIEKENNELEYIVGEFGSALLQPMQASNEELS